MNAAGKLEKIFKYVKYGLTAYSALVYGALWVDGKIQKRRARKRREEAEKKAKEEPGPEDGRPRRR